MRSPLPSVLLTALLGAGCVSSDDASDCDATERLVCRAPGDCRCGLQCRLGDACPRTLPGTPVCAEVQGNPGAGVCVDVSWVTGAPSGMIRCGESFCAATSSCVDWGSAGVRCAAPCRANGECPSGCCALVTERGTSRTYTLCAPNANFRCMAGMPAGQRCEPACADDAVCVEASPRPRCARRCATDSDCPGACCAEVQGGGRACATAAAGCRAPLPPACASYDDCVTVTYAARGDHCGGSPDSVEVRVRNDCTRAVDVQVCYERRDGTCTCGLHRNVAPGAEPSPPFWGCDLTGSFQVSSRAAGDAPGCHPGRCN